MKFTSSEEAILVLGEMRKVIDRASGPGQALEVWCRTGRPYYGPGSELFMNDRALDLARHVGPTLHIRGSIGPDQLPDERELVLGGDTV